MTVTEAQSMLAHWEEVVGKLEARKNELVELQSELRETRAKAVLAEAQGDEGARKVIAQVSRDALAAQGELESVDAALAEARKQVENARVALQDARRAKALEEYRNLAAQRRQIATDFEAQVEKLAALARQYNDIDRAQYQAARAAGLNLGMGQAAWLLGTCTAHHLRGLVEADWVTPRYAPAQRLAEADAFAQPDRLPGVAGGGKP